jgi:chromosomal replication initiation ATPase DnaA
MIRHDADARRARQLVLDLARAPSYDPDQFLVSPSNAAAHAAIEDWPDWTERTLLLIGPAGSGKSHLGAIWATRAGATIVLPTARFEPGTWSGPVLALLEDCDRAAHSEAALFHCINLVKETGGWLLITARTAPDGWGLATADLLSRLRLSPVATIDRPDNPLLRAVIVKLFADRQIRIDEDVVSYAALHCDQSLEAIAAFVAAVDDEALASGRRITRPLAAQILAALRPDAGGEP